MSFKSMIAQSKDKSFTYPTSQLFISLLHHVKKNTKTSMFDPCTKAAVKL
jgi:hypothetical protein